MNNDFIYTMLGAASTSIVTFLIGWGATRAKSAEQERRLERAENELAKQLELIHSLSDVYVNYKHFNEIMLTVRETQRELKEGLQKVLDILTSRS